MRSWALINVLALFTGWERGYKHNYYFPLRMIAFSGLQFTLYVGLMKPIIVNVELVQWRCCIKWTHL